MKHAHIAIIGAGVSGLAAARALPPESYTLFDKSKGPGGRLASKRINGSRADIGAQFFTTRDKRFETVVAEAISAGAVSQWQPRMGKIVNGNVCSSPDTNKRYIGTPYMNMFSHYLAKNIEATFETRFNSVTKEGCHFLLTDTRGKTITADKVLVTTPVDQMASLLLSFDTNLVATQFKMRPTWTCVFKVLQSLTTPDGEILEACFGGDHQTIDFVAMECSKKDRNSQFVVVHTTPDFSTTYLEASAGHILQLITTDLEPIFGSRVEPIIAHRWRYARPKEPTTTTQKGIFEISPNLWIAGDYLAGGRVEGAYLSGLEAATRLA